MPKVADYSIVMDHWLNIGSAATFEVPENVDLDSKTVLSFMLRSWSIGSLSIIMKLNGKQVWDWKFEDGDRVMLFQEVIPAGFLKPGKNKLSWDGKQEDLANLDLSDVVFWWQANI
jgi:hypothetical protein